MRAEPGKGVENHQKEKKSNFCIYKLSGHDPFLGVK
jgi:hypothetical protein